MEVAGIPHFRRGLKANLPQVSIAMTLPAGASVRVPIESETQADNGALVLTILPRRPDAGLGRETHPRLSASKHGLDIGLLGISHLNIVARSAAIHVAGARGLHRGRGATKVFEGSSLPILVNHPVPLENHTVLVFPQLVTLVKLGALLNADAKKIAEVDLLALLLSLRRELIPAHDLGLVPNLTFAESSPLLVSCLLRLGLPIDLVPLDRARDHGVEEQALPPDFRPMSTLIRDTRHSGKESVRSANVKVSR